MIARRRFLQVSGLALASLASGGAWAKRGVMNAAGDLAGRWAAIERESGGRLGVMLLDTAGGRRVGHRQDERFPMCSTFKFLLAAAVLKQVDAGKVGLDRRLPIQASDLVGHSPATGKHVGPDGLSVAEMCQATLIWSDNAAANLLYPLVGGPAGLIAFLRGIGDATTRTDRLEPMLNEFAPGDPRDTTTPAAMAGTLQRILLGDVLRPASRRRLTDWLIDNRTGNARLRAGLPPDWKIGDKTGSNGEDTVNDIAILWPPGRPPLLLAAYLNGAKVDAAGQDAALRAVAQAVVLDLQGAR
ncbi:class A beta-lactamase [Pseudomonas sp. Hp2]|uniref:class A beta-lactamase n=1 Tax=Pseudomonas sp. Hp2 TaxID=701189 RepID=UPI00112A6D71|nr:class A beta-lactamase [Pseudomonas sp. Hp2]